MNDPTWLTPAMARRFETKITEGPNGCWLWTAGKDGGGYGKFTTFRKTWSAHRWSYLYHVGEIPAGLQLDHLCRVRSCVNPAHLEPVTAELNVMRGYSPTAAAARSDTCPNGHLYTTENTIWKQNSPSGNPVRKCRTCRLAAWTRQNRKRRRRRT